MRKQEMDYILSRMLDSHGNVSDLNLTVGRPLQVESSGKLVKVDLEPDIKELSPFQTEQIAMNLINQDRRLTKALVESGSCDLSYSLPGKARFRVNIFSQSGNYSIVLRRLETTVPSIKELNLPKAFYEIPKLLNGIVFVTGATGTGKTTSLAAVLSEINATRPAHVITLEDPIEYQHAHKMATFNQRELGSDFESFASGLRAALRQAPKVILVGEMRDKETVEIGLRAAETGHLVLTTLHTNNAGATINRILGMFESDEEKQLRLRLADSVRWVICQRLLPKIGGGRVAAFEVLGTSLRVKDLILHGEEDGKTYDDVMEQGKHFGMTTFDNYIIQLYEQGLISQETAMIYSTHKAVVGRGIDAVKSARGEKTTDIEALEIDHGYKEKVK
ncbi:MAG: PilT/PilU family type 4a pilus ATPase [Desulfobacterales bacterium]|nr:PilT/PilU family type 4a pilus ATPase [Desulfobacterales bacterium]